MIWERKNHILILANFTFCSHLFLSELITCAQSEFEIELQKAFEIFDSNPNSVFIASIDKKTPIKDNIPKETEYID